MSARNAVEKLVDSLRVAVDVGRRIINHDLEANSLYVDDNPFHQIGKAIRAATAQHPRVVSLVPVAVVVVPHSSAVPGAIFEYEPRLGVESEVAVPPADAGNLGEDNIAVLIGAENKAGLAPGGTVERELQCRAGAVLASGHARVTEALECHGLVLPHLDCLQSQRVAIRGHKPSDIAEVVHVESLASKRKERGEGDDGKAAVRYATWTMAKETRGSKQRCKPNDD